MLKMGGLPGHYRYQTMACVNLRAVLACTLTAPGLAIGQMPPDGGALRQQIERELRPTPTLQAAPLKPGVVPAPKGVSVTVRSFRLTGNTLLTQEQLQAALAPYLNRPLDILGLRAAADAVEAAYREAGRIARATLPQQELVDGVVIIEIVEAHFGGVSLEGPVPARVTVERLLATVAAGQSRGSPLDAQALDRALLLADDLPGVTVAGSLRAGAKPGETELALQAADEPPINGNAGLDNTGSRSTSYARLTANLQANSPFGLGDSLGANLIHSRGSDYARLAWSLPLAHDGWRLGANASNLNYKLVTPEFSALNARGDSTSVGLEANYPLIRARAQNLYLSLVHEKKDFNNESAGATTTRYAIQNTTLSLSGNHFDALGGGGANSANLSVTRGEVQLGALDAGENAALAGGYGKLRYALTRQQTITGDLSGYLAYAGQRADKNLDSAEKFYLGGASGVRAYPSSEAGGVHGQLINLELRWRLPEGFNLTGFYDWGRVQVNYDNSAGANPNKIALMGAGLALGWQGAKGADLKAVWARRIGDNPNPTSTGNDQDGSLLRDRFWFTALMAF